MQRFNHHIAIQPVERMRIANMVFKIQNASAIRVPAGILITVAEFTRNLIALLRYVERMLIAMQVLMLSSVSARLASLAIHLFNASVSIANFNFINFNLI